MPHKRIPNRYQRLLKFLLLLLILSLYILYVFFIVQKNQGPIDYETFMRIGHQFLNGEEVYGENSYYPLPYVMVFAFFAWLPRPVSMVLWLLLPVIAALAISGWRPWVLLYAPLFGHFLGGQTAVFGMVGLWGYRRSQDPDKIAGGIYLALTLLKPQLGVIPCAWAAVQWWKFWREKKRLPRQFLAWLGTLMVIYLPGFFLQPDWIGRWLQNPRPLMLRALSGMIPRTLYLLFPQGVGFWVFWLLISLGLLAVIYHLNQRRLDLDVLTLWYFVASPLVHDYDLIQIIPILDQPVMQWTAVLLSIPTWLVILFAYDMDAAWFAATIIAPGVLAMLLYQRHQTVMYLAKLEAPAS